MAASKDTSPTPDFKIVVAIDFGTCLSSYAFSSLEEYKTNPLEIHHFQYRNSTPNHRNVKKTATCVLFDAEKKFQAFGYNAKAKYAELLNDRRHDDFYYFENFKMNPYDTQGSLKELMVMDIQQKKTKQMSALEIFSASIRAMKDDVITRIVKTGRDAPEKYIRWVLTVPAIWHESSKSFMRESARLAGIPSNQLLIALEPEAASVFCQFRVMENQGDVDSSITQDGTQYVVVDIGGGTTDITLHQKLSNSNLKELRKPEGSNVTSTSVDQSVMQLFENIFGHAFLKRLRLEYPDLYLELDEKVEDMKKSLPQKESVTFPITLPVISFNAILQEIDGIDVKEAVLKYEKNYQGNDKVSVSFKKDRMFMNTDDLRKLFTPSINKIINKVSEVLSFDTPQSVSIIILVGGFAECTLLEEAITKAFPTRKVIVPLDACLAVLKGAVLFGHEPEKVNPRLTRFAYALSTRSSFDFKKHLLSKRSHDDWGNVLCDDCFQVPIIKAE